MNQLAIERELQLAAARKNNSASQGSENKNTTGGWWRYPSQKTRHMMSRSKNSNEEQYWHCQHAAVPTGTTWFTNPNGIHESICIRHKNGSNIEKLRGTNVSASLNTQSTNKKVPVAG